MKNFVSEGYAVSLTAPYAVTSGQGLLVGSLFGVATCDADVSTEVEAQIVGVITLAKTTGEAWTQGDKIYWDDAARECTTTATDNNLIGVATRDVASANATGRVRLNGVSV